MILCQKQNHWKNEKLARYLLNYTRTGEFSDNRRTRTKSEPKSILGFRALVFFSWTTAGERIPYCQFSTAAHPETMGFAAPFLPEFFLHL